MISVKTGSTPSASATGSSPWVSALSAISMVSPTSLRPHIASTGRSPGSSAIRRSSSLRSTSIMVLSASASMTSARIDFGRPSASRRQKSCRNDIVIQVQATRSVQLRPRVRRSNSRVGAMNGLIDSTRSALSLSSAAARVENRWKHSSATTARVDSVSRSVAS